MSKLIAITIIMSVTIYIGFGAFEAAETVKTQMEERNAQMEQMLKY